MPALSALELCAEQNLLEACQTCRPAALTQHAAHADGGRPRLVLGPGRNLRQRLCFQHRKLPSGSAGGGHAHGPRRAQAGRAAAGAHLPEEHCSFMRNPS